MPAPPPPSSRALVWFKRDLRLADHAPLVAALAHGDAVGLFIIEPEWLHSPECSPSHVAFTLACLAELRAAWEAWEATMPPIPEDATVSLGYGAKDMPQR